ncbi:MAG: DUF5704 domain-containing protein [Lachnospiraceae bacterium]|nr:DUF5704 domain-containing protein [Lachnospiraceae bacterium]
MKKFMITMLFFFFLIFPKIVYASDELYFNSDGDLIFSTYDKKATSGIRYKTMGWVIKRYDDSIQAAGQYHVNIPRSGYMYEMEDTNQPGYIYTTFIVDGENILKNIAKVSSEWKHQLENYGGYVYIDSIMTVTENGVCQGGVNSDGSLYGEIYDTYQGIRNARAWQDGDKLKGYYDLKVKYPYVVKSLTQKIIDKKVTDKAYSSQVDSSYCLGSESLENERYDVSEGIPAGENLYLSGNIGKFRYTIDYQTVEGYVYIPVKVSTNYCLRWRDTKGSYHSEIQAVDRWYYVTKKYEYTRISNIQVYDLRTMNLCSYDGTPSQNLGEYHDRTSYNMKNYGSSPAHLNVKALTNIYVGTVVVDSSNGQRPSIPDDDQQYLAQQAVQGVDVWSDRLLINQYLLLSDSHQPALGKVLTAYKNIPRQEIYVENIQIPEDTLNQTTYRKWVSAGYVSQTKKWYDNNYKVNQIVVHTPVVADLEIKGDKEKNENIKPTAYDVVIGGYGTLSIGSVAQHREILGYGYRNYRAYAKKYYVRFPFAVIYNGEQYPENTWIESEKSLIKFQVPEYVKEGSYEAECRVVAANTPDYYLTPEMMDGITQAEGNLELKNYCASDVCKINVIGCLYGFYLECQNQKYRGGAETIFPEPVHYNMECIPIFQEENSSEVNSYTIGLYANGVGDEKDEQIEVDVSYYVIQENENHDFERKEVDVYLAEKENFTKETLKKAPQYLEWKAEDARKISEGVYCYEGELNLGKQMILVEKGKDFSHVYSDVLLMVHVDVYGSDENGRKLSYENAQNELLGYCNMWKKESYNVDKYPIYPLKCGDIILIGSKEMMKRKAMIIGTH